MSNFGANSNVATLLRLHNYVIETRNKPLNKTLGRGRTVKYLHT